MRISLKHRLYIITGIILLGGFTVFGFSHLLPSNILYIHEKPLQEPVKRYQYYRIIAEDDQRTLMYVPVAVTVGDELITEENQRYKVVRIEENRAYARFVENVPLKKYAP
jgi:hypothetical protein